MELFSWAAWKRVACDIDLLVDGDMGYWTGAFSTHKNPCVLVCLLPIDVEQQQKTRYQR